MLLRARTIEKCAHYGQDKHAKHEQYIDRACGIATDAYFSRALHKYQLTGNTLEQQPRASVALNQPLATGPRESAW